MLNLRCQSTLSFSDGFGSGRHGRPASGRTRQVVAVRRRCPRLSGRCCHDNAMRRWIAYLFCPCLLASSVHAEPSATPLRHCRRAHVVALLTRCCVIAHSS